MLDALGCRLATPGRLDGQRRAAVKLRSPLMAAADPSRGSLSGRIGLAKGWWRCEAAEDGGGRRMTGGGSGAMGPVARREAVKFQRGGDLWPF
jgi:hypothetical protein